MNREKGESRNRPTNHPLEIKQLPNYSLKRLLISVALISIGLGFIVFLLPFRQAEWRSSGVLLWFCSGIAVRAGRADPVQKRDSWRHNWIVGSSDLDCDLPICAKERVWKRLTPSVMVIPFFDLFSARHRDAPSSGFD